MTCPASESSQRLELTLHKPWFGWFPKPTVVFDGRGQPAQWGSGTWQMPEGKTTLIKVFLFNRIWKFGTAEILVNSERPTALMYSAPWLPFLGGKLRFRV